MCRKGFIGWDWDAGCGCCCTLIFKIADLNQLENYSPRFDCVKLSSTVAGSLSIFFGCFSSSAGNDTSIPMGGALWESSDVSPLSWKSSVRGTSILRSGALGESSMRPLLAGRKWGRRSEGEIRWKVLVSNLHLTLCLDEQSIHAMKDLR